MHEKEDAELMTQNCRRHLDMTGLDWFEQCFTSPPTQDRLYGRQFLQVKRPNQQYQSTEGRSTKDRSKQRKQLNTHIHRQ